MAKALDQAHPRRGTREKATEMIRFPAENHIHKRWTKHKTVLRGSLSLYAIQ